MVDWSKGYTWSKSFTVVWTKDYTQSKGLDGFIAPEILVYSPCFPNQTLVFIIKSIILIRNADSESLTRFCNK